MANDLKRLFVSVFFVLIMAAGTLIGMVMPELNKQLFSTVLHSGSVQKLVSMGIFMVCASLSAHVFDIVQGLATVRINTKLDILFVEKNILNKAAEYGIFISKEGFRLDDLFANLNLLRCRRHFV